jgi:hypothetical protein
MGHPSQLAATDHANRGYADELRHASEANRWSPDARWPVADLIA